MLAFPQKKLSQYTTGNDCLNIKRNTGASSLARLRSNLPGIPSGPEDLLVRLWLSRVENSVARHCYKYIQTEICRAKIFFYNGTF